MFFRPIITWQDDVGKVVEAKGFVRAKHFSDVDLLLSKLALVHSEVSEAVEAARHQNWSNFKEEIADTVIRCLDLADSLDFDLENEMRKKMEINKARPHRWKVV